MQNEPISLPISTTTSPATAMETYTTVNRFDTLSPDAIKVTPEADLYPPVLHSDEYLPPVPLGSGVNTAGGEDSPFITPDGNTLYFFFTPDVSIPAEKQVIDGVTGVYISRKVNGDWRPAERVILQDDGSLSMDGAVCVQGDTMWFASVRFGNFREVDIWTATYKDGRWQDWHNAGAVLNVQYQVGELHVTADGSGMYFHSSQTGGKGGIDIRYTEKVNDMWQEPQNVGSVNTPGDEGWPFVTPDGSELWFLRTFQGTPAIYVSHLKNGQWSEPELVISQFAGEPTLDAAGNIYFVHHFYKDGQMTEADIYVAYKK